jgi:hypothetical protein
MKYFLSVLLILTSFNVFAQETVQAHIDIGENSVSEGGYIKNAYRCSYQYHKYKIEGGIQIDLLSNNPNTLTGLDIIASREFLINNFPLELKGFFVLNRFSDLMHETNWGLRIASKKFNHLLLELGTNFRTYSINSSARQEYNINKTHGNLSENFNLMYAITAYLKPQYHNWNIGLSITNVDYYVINQSTNPVFNMQAMYKLKPNLMLNIGAWYKQAGIFNINVNYFGYFIRGGIIWTI